MKLRGKVAIITGAASGIGQASAIAFAREGAKVVVVDVNERGGEEALGKVHALGGEGYFDHADVSNESAVRKMVSDTIARWGRIDILFNNAGVVLVKPLEETTEAEWDRVISINLKAAFLTIKHVVPHMRRGGRGAILNTGSITSIVGQLHTPAYCASKGAIALMTKSLALDYGRDQSASTACVRASQIHRCSANISAVAQREMKTFENAFRASRSAKSSSRKILPWPRSILSLTIPPELRASRTSSMEGFWPLRNTTFVYNISVCHDLRHPLVSGTKIVRTDP